MGGDSPDLTRQKEFSHGVELTARTGYAAKGLVYSVIGGLAVQQAIGSGGEITNTREALREIGEAPFGAFLLGLVTLGLAAYVIWCLVQAVLDPEGDEDDPSWKRWAIRLFALGRAGIYTLLTYSGIRLLMGSGDGGGGTGSQGPLVDLMTSTWGVILVGLVGAGIIAHGLRQIVRAYTTAFTKKLEAFDLPSRTASWVLTASRVGLTARGVAFGMIGSSILVAAANRNPGEARGTDGVLQSLVGRPWLLGAMGAGLVCYGIYQWVKARYRIIGV